MAGTTGSAGLVAISCSAPGVCSAIGSGYFVEKSSHAATVTAVTPSPAKVPYGHEQTEKLSVTVAATTPSPSGTVTVLWRGVTICRITLAKAGGSCTLTPKQLPPGSYNLVAKYTGDANFTGSSAKKTLTILRCPPAGSTARLIVAARHVNRRTDYGV